MGALSPAVRESADPQSSLSGAPDTPDRKPWESGRVGFLGPTSVFNPGGMLSWKTRRPVDWTVAIWVTG